MALKTRPTKPAKRAHRTAKAKQTPTVASKAPGSEVKKITRPYLAPFGKSEVGVTVIRKAVRKAAKDALRTEAKTLKKTAKAL